MTSSDMSLASEHVQRLLQCAVCLERFKQPKLLPCQHTFCLTPCLEGLVDRRTRSIRCPECRADHFVPRNGPASFPNNLTIIGFLELSSAAGRAIESMGRGEIMNEIMNDVRPLREFLQPQRAASPQFVPQDAAGAEGGGCYICHNEGRIIRCCHCDQLVCEDCRRSHMEQVRTDVTRMINQVRRGLPQMTDFIIAIGRKGTQLQNNCERVKGDISDALEKHIRELKTRERVLREEVDTFLAGELRNLRTHQENAEVEIASLASFCDSAETVLSMTRPLPDGDLVEMKGQCQEHLETVHCYEDGTIRPPALKHIQATLESPFLSSTISNFGDLIITSRTAQAQSQATSDDPLRRTEVMSREWTLVSPQLEQLSSRGGNALQAELRASSISPNATRRQLSPSTAIRASQVRFDDIEPPVDNSRIGVILRSANLHRRSRQERRSDTEIARIGARSLDISPQARDRTRHLSLGALPAATEYLEEESPEPEPNPPGLSISRQENRSDTNTGLSATYPGARSHDFLPPSLRFSLSTAESEENSHGSTNGTLSFSNGNNPSIYVNTPRNKYNQKGTAVLRFGQRGSGTVEFTWPRGVAVSPLEDKIYVADSSNHRVQVFDNTGRFQKCFGSYGQGDGEFDCLAGIAINGLGQVIIADRYNHRVQIFDRNGRFQNAFGSEGSSEGQLNYPWGVACDNMGFIYVCDKENHRVQVFQSNGTFVRMFGQFGNRTGQFENPHYIAVSPDNKVYVSDSSNHRIQVFSMYGDFLFSFGTCGVLRGQMKFPRGIAVDNQGFVVVADSGNNRIQIFRADGRFYTMFGSWGSENGHFKGLEGLAILANGNVVVSDRENHRIQIF
ncbi:hypothetical protein BsWGS_05337 [Bradybaena similaris]